jgi:hypothetical protein
MQVVAREQSDLARSESEALPAFAFDAKAKLSLDDIVKEDEMGCRPENRRAVLGCEADRYTPWRAELGVQEHTAGQMHDPQDIR